MNRIIIIGNGFDLAHGLKTGYRDFIDHYWENVSNSVFGSQSQYLEDFKLSAYEDDLVNFRVIDGRMFLSTEFITSGENESPYTSFCSSIRDHNLCCDSTGHLVFKNNFFGSISQKCSLVDWVDIENEYYAMLKKLVREKDPQKRNEEIKKLNNEFEAVKKLLEKYLDSAVGKYENVNSYDSIKNIFCEAVKFNDILSSRGPFLINYAISFIDKFNLNAYGDLFENAKEELLEYADPSELSVSQIDSKMAENAISGNLIEPLKTFLLNFNYTKTAEKIYNQNAFYEVINIHGELHNKNNPIIFGYGDELDDDYKNIEKLQDNDFLENIKSIRYHKTRNYRNLLSIIEAEPYQIFIMGHSCGNSDRTLLNTLFEHKNCISVKVFYRQFEDGTDDYTKLIMNISRCFNDKARMRDIVVNWEDCSPLVPAPVAPK